MTGPKKVLEYDIIRSSKSVDITRIWCNITSWCDNGTMVMG